MLIATHNLMHGRRLADLIRHYRALREERDLAVLCVQENRTDDDRSHSQDIARELGPGYAELSEPGLCGKGLVYDCSRLELAEHVMVRMPQLSTLSWLERRYIAGGVPDQRYLQVARFRTEAGSLVVLNFHLDTAGGNHHRRQQVEAIAELAAAESGPVVVCGDTNAFALRRRRHPGILRWLLEPLTERGFQVETDGAPTHFFGRQREPMLAHRMTVLLGKLGLDIPLRYDIVSSNAPIAESGELSTPESDHDLVWAVVDTGE